MSISPTTVQRFSGCQKRGCGPFLFKSKKFFVEVFDLVILGRCFVGDVRNLRDLFLTLDSVDLGQKFVRVELPFVL